MEEVRRSLEAECPRRIIGELHACGHFIHGRSSRFPHKVLCITCNGATPDGWEPTEAQRRFWQMAQAVAVA